MVSIALAITLDIHVLIAVIWQVRYEQDCEDDKLLTYGSVDRDVEYGPFRTSAL